MEVFCVLLMSFIFAFMADNFRLSVLFEQTNKGPRQEVGRPLDRQ
jgi:hypothetical protein